MKILSIRKKEPVKTTIPDGFYKGLWGGSVIALTYNHNEYELETEEGVRGINIPVVVTIEKGVATFEEFDN